MDFYKYFIEISTGISLKFELDFRWYVGHLHAEEVEKQIPPERQGGHLQAEEVEFKVQLITEHMVISCMQEKIKIKFNSI